MAPSARFPRHLLSLALLLIEAYLVSGKALRARREQPKLSVAKAQQSQACSELVNHGTHFTVDVEVGTPGQKFSVVADTGSNTLIVPSCLCQKSGSCGKTDRCFMGTNHSSTFSLINGTHGPAGLLLSFGSGQVQGVLARETVQIGQLKAPMQDGILLMTAKALSFGGPFEGILGLGIPHKEQEAVDLNRPSAAPHGVGPHGMKGSATANQAVQDIIKKIKDMIKSRMGNSSGSAPAPGRTATLSQEDTDVMAMAAVNGELAVKQPGGFLEQAHIGRFSMCFNEGANGVLRVGTPPAQMTHGSVGTEHWGLDFRGVSVGKSSVPLQFCSAENMTKGQQSPCGAIPDSGTTLIMAPKEHLNVLFEEVCESWERCRRNYTALTQAAKAASDAAKEHYGFNPFDISTPTKSTVFQYLLQDCEAWIQESTGLDELPELSFHVQGSNGTKQTLAIPGSSYVLAMEHSVAGPSPGVPNITEVVKPAKAGDKKKTVCQAAFGPMDYNTAANGPVWILGTPLFYEFNVGYDLFSKPPAISFSSTKDSPCGACDKEVGLVSATASRTRARSPRVLPGPPRMPSYDTSRPL